MADQFLEEPDWLQEAPPLLPDDNPPPDFEVYEALALNEPEMAPLPPLEDRSPETARTAGHAALPAEEAFWLDDDFFQAPSAEDITSAEGTVFSNSFLPPNSQPDPTPIDPVDYSETGSDQDIADDQPGAFASDTPFPSSDYPVDDDPLREQAWEDVCDQLGVDRSPLLDPDPLQKETLEAAIAGIGFDPQSFDATRHMPDLIDPRTGSIGWVGVFQPDTDVPDQAYPGILMLLPDSDDRYEAAFAPLQQCDSDTALAHAENLLKQAHSTDFDTFMQDAITQVEREGITFAADELPALAPDLFEDDMSVMGGP